VGEKCSDKFRLRIRLPRNSRELLHAANLRHGTDGFTSPPKEGVLRIFSPLKIRRHWPGLNPRTWVPKASTLPLDHRSRLVTYKQHLFFQHNLHTNLNTCPVVSQVLGNLRCKILVVAATTTRTLLFQPCHRQESVPTKDVLEGSLT